MTAGARETVSWPAEVTTPRPDASAQAEDRWYSTAQRYDVSERVRAEQALKVSEEHYRRLFEANPNPMWVHDAESLRFLAVNEAATYGYGYSREEFLAMTIEDLRSPEDVAKLRGYLAAQSSDGRTALRRAGVWRHRRKDGTSLDVEVTTHDHEFEGRPASVVLALDVTDRVRGQEALRRSEARYRDLFENATDLIATTDVDGCLTAVNQAFKRTLGYEAAELLGKPILELVPSEWHERLEHARHGKVHREVESTVYEHDLMAKDGSRIRVEVASRLLEEDGRPAGVEAICRDISDRTRADKLEGQLRQAQRLESVGRLAGGIAHDFNNLLTVISGYTEALLAEHEPGSAPELVEIAAAAKRAATLTHQLLAFSRRQVLQPRVIDLNDVVSGLMPMLTRLIGADIELAARLDRELDHVHADPSQIEQILVNLVVNARDAMPNGGALTIETTNVDIDAEYIEQHPEATPGRHAMLAVTDTGTGMTSETIAQMFEPFYTTKPIDRGTGLGLSTVYGIVKQSGGSIWVYSEPGKGSSFKVHLPASLAPLTAEPRTLGQPIAPNGTETILIAEDEPALRALTARMLASRGYSVIAADTPQDALRLLDADDRSIDLLLTDLVMPQMDGHELARRVHERLPGLRVLYMSGYADTVVTRNVSHELPPLLEKPFSAGDLARTVREVLDAPSPRATGTLMR
jgi:two-component system cell cycle sensor histidine kinase/response regulator CckA